MYTIKTKYEQFVNKIKKRSGALRAPLSSSPAALRVIECPVAVYLYAVSFGFSLLNFQNLL